MGGGGGDRPLHLPALDPLGCLKDALAARPGDARLATIFASYSRADVRRGLARLGAHRMPKGRHEGELVALAMPCVCPRLTARMAQGE